MNRANLKKRVLFAVGASPVFWWIINSPFSLFQLLPRGFTEQYLDTKVLYPGHIATIIIIFIACYEYLQMLSRHYPKNGFWVAYIWLAFQAISVFIPDKVLSIKQDTYILLLLVALEAFAWGKLTGRWKRASLLFSGMIFLQIAFSSIVSLYEEPFQAIFPRKFDNPMLSQLGIIVVLAPIFLCDTVAYFVGSIFGKHHFSSISPKKTIEGSVAGFIASIIMCTIGWHFLADEKYPWVLGAFLGVLIGAFAQIGDLLVSLMKRYFKVKDASNIIPGHGGVLDRFDSVFFTVPVINLFIIITVKFIH